MAAESLYSPFLSDALVILGAAGLVIPVFTRFRITPIIGFILVGLLVGPYGLGRYVFEHPWLAHVTISDPDGLEVFAEFGIILLLFSIGLELSFGRLWSLRKLVFGLGSLELILLGASFTFILAGFGQPVTGALALGLALALSSTALVLGVTNTNTPVGRAALSMLLFEDIAIVPIIFLLGALGPQVAAQESSLVQTLLLGVAVIGGLLVIGRLVLPRLFSQAARTKSPELFLAASLLVVIIASLATAAVGLSPIVGALIAGLLIAETEYHHEVENITEPFKGLALGVFLITIGMSIDLRAVWDNLGIILAATVGVLLLKATVTALLLRLMGARRGTSTEAGILMSSPSETTLIVLSAATTAQLIQPGTAQFWQIVTAIGMTITPILALVGRIAARRVDSIEASPIPRDDELGEGRSIIIGFGRVGRLVADMLDKHGKPYIAIDSDTDSVTIGLRDGYNVVFGDASVGTALTRIGVEDATAVIITMDEPVAAQRIVKRLRAKSPDLPIIARARDASHAATLYRDGASHAVPETLESSLQLSEAVLVDLGVPMGPVIVSIHEMRDSMRDQIMSEGELERRPALRSSSLRDKRDTVPTPS
jgi:CPA2 family monovalent cation:H+ antiporter-2